jgi:hypothetical protein
MLKREIAKIKEGILSIIEEGRHAGLKSEVLVDNILNTGVADGDIVVIEDKRERPLYINEIAVIAKKALKQAEFEGGFLVLPSGEKIKRKEKTFTSIKGGNENPNGMCKVNERHFERISSNVKVSFDCCKTSYRGIAINLSANGMLIRTEEISFPLDMRFEIFMPLQKEILHIPVEVSRLMKSHDYYDSLGIKLLNPSQKYLDFINNLN